MTLDLQQEMVELRNQATRRLRTGFPQEWRDQRLVQLIVMPSFHAWTSWELYQKRVGGIGDGSNALVIGVWRQDIDAEKLHDPVTRLRYPTVLEPTVEVSVRQVSNEVVQATLDDLCNTKV